MQALVEEWTGGMEVRRKRVMSCDVEQAIGVGDANDSSYRQQPANERAAITWTGQ